MTDDLRTPVAEPETETDPADFFAFTVEVREQKRPRTLPPWFKQWFNRLVRHPLVRRLGVVAAAFVLALSISGLVGPAEDDQEAAAPLPAESAQAQAQAAAQAAVPSAPPIVPATSQFQPVQVAIPSLRVSTVVEPTSTRADGQMGIPDDPEVVGWWERSAPANAAAGNTVLAGHIFNKAYGPGAFFHLQNVEAGDSVIATAADGTGKEYTVTSVELVPKSDFPMGRVFAFEGPHQLVLATCGGTYDPTSGQYHDNILVFAQPV